MEVVKNGLVECQHRHVVETGLTLLSQHHMPSSYWVAAFNTALYLINHLPSRLLGFKCPFEFFFFNFQNMKFFVCLVVPVSLVFVHITKKKKEFRSKSYVFNG